MVVFLFFIFRFCINYCVQVVRTAQYGCNCRGMGGNGGCGEFDIVEAGVYMVCTWATNAWSATDPMGLHNCCCFERGCECRTTALGS